MNALERYQKKIATELESKSGYYQDVSEVRRNILSVLHHTIGKIFPRTLALISDQAIQFELEYLQSFPPRFANMELCVSYFPLFLKEKARKKKVAGFISELTDLEWSLFFVGVDPLDEHALKAQLPPQSVCFNPICRILKLEYDVLSLIDTPVGNLADVQVELRRQIIHISRNRELRIVKRTHLSLEMAQILDLLEDQPMSLTSLKAMFSQHNPNVENFDEYLKALLDIQAVIVS